MCYRNFAFSPWKISCGKEDETTLTQSFRLPCCSFWFPFSVCFNLHSLHKIIKLVSFWSAWPKDCVCLKLREEILNEVYSHRGVAMDAGSVQIQSLWIYEAKEMGFVQTFNGFHACSRVMNYISTQVLVDKSDSFSIRNILIQRIRVCAKCVVHCTSLATLQGRC